MLGKLIVIDGTDGSGKKTQTDLLIARMRADGIKVHPVSFPRYGKPSAYFVERYLRGGYGSLEECGAKRGSLFYALDRFDAAADIREALAGGAHVVADRYVASNMGHQGSKIADAGARKAYLAWNDELEHEVLGIPRPDLNLILHVPGAVAHELKKQAGGKDGNPALDLHESDLEHLRAAEACYQEIAAAFPNFRLIECMDGDRLRTKDEVQASVWDIVRPLFSNP